MRKEKSKIKLLVFGILLLLASTPAKEDVTFKLECQKLLSKEFEVTLPIPFRLQKENSEGGIIYFYSFPDLSYIIICQNTAAYFPPDEYEPEKESIVNQRKISVGQQDDKFWRKDVLDDVRVYYDNVTSENKEMYNCILNNLKIVPL